MKQILDNTKDNALIQKFLEGNLDSLGELYTEHHLQLRNFGKKICNNTEDGEEVVQEAYVRALKSLHNFEMRGKVKNWFYTTIKRICIRKQKKEKKELIKLLSKDNLVDIIDSLDSDLDDAENDLMNKQLRTLINDALVQLPKKYSKVIILKDIDGLKSKYITEILEISPENLRIRLHRGRTLLRNKLKKLT